jgi:hypothetical protein
MLRKIFLIHLALFAGCSSHRDSGNRTDLRSDSQSDLGFDLVSMGSVWAFRIKSPDLPSDDWWQLKSKTQQILETYDRTFSSWRKDSEVNKLEKSQVLTEAKLKNLQASELFREGFQWALDAKNLSLGAFNILSSQGLDFGGLTKGHVLGALAAELWQRGFHDFQINGGGGNQVFAGSFIPSGRFPKAALVFRSASKSHQEKRQHIFDRSTPEKPIKGETVVYCWSVHPEDAVELRHHGAFSDALSTALLVRREGWKLPPYCSEREHVSLNFEEAR